MAIAASVIVLPVPMFLVPNAPEAVLVSIVTVSPVSTPTSAAEPTCKMDVALVVALYTRDVAVTPLTVSDFAVIEAVTPVGCVSE